MSNTTILKNLLNHSRDLGFEQSTVSKESIKTLSTRIANNTICRENVWLETSAFSFGGVVKAKKVNFSDSSASEKIIQNKITEAYESAGNLTPDDEYVAPLHSQNSITWNKSVNTPLNEKSIEKVYRGLSQALELAREAKFRASGVIVLEEVSVLSLHSSGFELNKIESGIDIKICLDNPSGGESSVSQLFIPMSEIDTLENQLIFSVKDAINYCKIAATPTEIEPANYTVILSPAALRGMLSSTANYGFFNKRVIDEGRTYLSNFLQKTKFPNALSLTFGDNLMSNFGSQIIPCPFNFRGVSASPVHLIKDGKMNDFFYSPYWAKKQSQTESFQFGDHQTASLNIAANSDIELYANDEALIKGTKNGIYIRDFWYIRSVSQMEGIITGMTRDGVFEIKNGKITRPLKNMRWHQNPIKVLENIDAASQTTTLISNQDSSIWQLPTIRSNNFHFSSVTKF